MLTDHAGDILFPSWLWMRMIGRLAFPIFAFFVAEGFYHTRSVGRYAARLALFALISEIPFNLMHSGRILDFDAQNIFFTLLIGLVTIYGVSYINKPAVKTPALLKKADAYAVPPDPHDLPAKRTPPASNEALIMRTPPAWPLSPAQAAVLVAGMFAAELLRTDYGAFGVIAILIFFFFRERRAAALLCIIAINLVHGLLSFASGYLPIQALAGLSAIPLFFYNGERGIRVKYMFYVFYPLHILILVLIKIYIGSL